MPKSRIILITGVSRGLGLAMSHKFTALDHTVIDFGRSRKTIAKLQSELDDPHRISVVDVTLDA